MDNLNLLKEIKEKLQSEFPGYIDKVIMYGSRVKGNATEDSDYDILVILTKNYDWQLKNKIYDLIYYFDLKYSILVDIRIISKTELGTIKGKQPFIQDAFDYGLTA